MLRMLKLWFPAIIPSWRFFDEIAPSPRIEFALLQTAEDTPTAWREFQPRPLRVPLRYALGRLFWNPRWNESLFLVNCAERLMQHPTAHSQWEIMRRIEAALAHAQEKSAPYLLFRLVFVHRNADEQLERHVAYVSPVHLRGQGL